MNSFFQSNPHNQRHGAPPTASLHHIEIFRNEPEPPPSTLAIKSRLSIPKQLFTRAASLPEVRHR
jgi:hypothetical protein